MNLLNEKTKKGLFTGGCVAIAVSLLVLLLTSIYQVSGSVFFEIAGSFFVNYAISIIYMFFVLFSNKPFFKFRQIDRTFIIIILILFSISAFTLNFSIPVFARFTEWVVVYLILFYIALLGFCFIEKLPHVLRMLIFFLLGSGLVLISYFVAYLSPYYLFSIIGLFVLGISVHMLIPLILELFTIVFIFKTRKNKAERLSLISGIIVPLIFMGVFLYQWNGVNREIRRVSSSIITRPDNTLPDWVLLCQEISNDPFSQKILKGDIVYQTFRSFGFGLGDLNFEEVKTHDPLINIGMAIFGDLDLDITTRIRILKSQFNARHKAQRRLWTGEDLGTIEVLNNIKVYPDYRLAYTEKILTVKSYNKWANNQQEAVYTFYLPEGSVATSLSLWIEGKEEQSRLTTKSKADSAYTSIVGVEQRDPALMHWQEGNTITVRVFPCTPAENRRFKIGITTPLEKTGDILKLKSVYFDGPVASHISETTQVMFESESQTTGIEMPSGFKTGSDNTYIYSGSYKPYWEILCDASPLSSKTFSFNDYTYSVQELSRRSIDFDPGFIYLDINSSWTKEEYKQVMHSYQNKKLYAFHDKLIEITPSNKEMVFKNLNTRNFSLFPFDVVKDVENSLVITKSNELSPNISDLEGSIFLKNIIDKTGLTESRPYVYQLGKTTSPYLKSLKEFQVIEIYSGGLETLIRMATDKKCYRLAEEDNSAIIDISDIVIKKESGSVGTGAPDHLLRLFAYNKLMSLLGKDYFTMKDGQTDSVVSIANEAYIVSPVSSLIVLETIKDYEQFNIPENENSLKNASIKSSGAVPEPGEWVLIGFVLLLLFLLYFKKDYFRALRWK